MHILLVQENHERRNLLAFAFEKHFNAEVAAVAHSYQAMDTVMEDRPLSLIICEDTHENDRLFKYLVSVGSKIPLLVLRAEQTTVVTAFPDLKVIGSLPSDTKPDALVAKIAEAITAGFVVTGEQPSDYCRIRTELLLKVVPLQVDVYLRLSSIKFIKLFANGDEFTANDLDRYLVKKKIQYLYLMKESSKSFLNAINIVLTKIIETKTIEPPPPPGLAVSVQDTMVELYKQFGFTPEIKQIVDSNVKIIIEGAKTTGTLSELLKKLDIESQKYMPLHSVLTAHLACACAQQLGWISDYTFEKLTYAALLHDITIVDEPVSVPNPLVDGDAGEARYFNKEKSQKFYRHPIEAAELINTLREVPGDVDKIVMEHHERPDGTGFPHRLTAIRIAPLAALFIFVHDLISGYLHPDASLKQVVEKYRAEYSHGHFKQIVEAIKV